MFDSYYIPPRKSEWLQKKEAEERKYREQAEAKSRMRSLIDRGEKVEDIRRNYLLTEAEENTLDEAAAEAAKEEELGAAFAKAFQAANWSNGYSSRNNN